MKQLKIILFANTDWYLHNFRLALAMQSRKKGWEVVMVSPPGRYGPKLEELGFRWIPLPFSTRSANPVHDLTLVGRLLRLYRRERPDLVHHFTIKCVLYGTIAAKLAGGISVVNAVTGLGHIFTDTGPKARMICPFVRLLYRYALSGGNVRVIYQNSEDRDSFVKWGLVDKARTHLIRGSGVNAEVFKPLGVRTSDKGRHVTALFASRIIREKGIYELMEAARMLRAKGTSIEVLMAGDIYPENPSSLSESEIAGIKREGILTYLGHVDDIKSLLERCDMVVLPSYREGTPRVLIEAAAMEKPIVATDIAGCAGLVVDGVNGLLVPVRDAGSLAVAMEKLALDREMRERFGRAGREIVLRGFAESIVLEETNEVYRELIPT